MFPAFLVRSSVLVVALGAAAIPVFAASSAEGYWSGAIQNNGKPLPLMFEITRQEETWNVAVYLPEQRMNGVQMIQVKIEAPALSFQIPGPPGAPRFAGRLSEDGQSIEGHYSQGRRSTPFRVQRAEKPAESDEPAR